MSKTNETAKAPAKAKTKNLCGCFTRWDDKHQAYVQCADETARKFAPGHDARLKGLLIRLHVAGEEYPRLIGGSVVTTTPMAVAKEYGWGHYLTDAKDRHAAKVKAKQERVAARVAAHVEKAKAKGESKPSTKSLESLLPQTKAAKKGFHPVRVKIGRWEYDATVEAEGVNSLTVSYLDKKGNRKVEDVKRSQVVG